MLFDPRHAEDDNFRCKASTIRGIRTNGAKSSAQVKAVLVGGHQNRHKVPVPDGTNVIMYCMFHDFSISACTPHVLEFIGCSCISCTTSLFVWTFRTKRSSSCCLGKPPSTANASGKTSTHRRPKHSRFGMDFGPILLVSDDRAVHFAYGHHLQRSRSAGDWKRWPTTMARSAMNLVRGEETPAFQQLYFGTKQSKWNGIAMAST